MLKYLIAGTESLIGPAVLLGLLFSYARRAYGEKGRNITAAGALLGILSAAVMAYLKNKTKHIDTGMWNLHIFAAWIGAFVIFAIADMKVFRKKDSPAQKLFVPVISAALSFGLLFYCLPDVMAYPYTIVLGGESVFSTGFLYRIIGLVLGILLSVLAGTAVCSAGCRMEAGTLGIFTRTALLVNGVQWFTKILQTLLTRRKISGKTIFRIVKFTSNHSSLFIYLILLSAAVIPLVLLLRSMNVNEPYENPAQHRKIKAKWRSVRRWSATVCLSFLLAVLNLTVVKAYANRPVELSPVEECEVLGDSVRVPFEAVEDGHLHRFGYKTPNGKTVRFIVIRKPNSSSYGIGLDACDICGETGYFERNGQIVCKLCDVVMNVNTIGFKGGCNPKVIEYRIENGQIIVPTSTLIEHEGDFK